MSGPLLDRFDLRLEVHRPAANELLFGPPNESSAAVAQRVARVRSIAAQRGAKSNATLSAAALDEHAPLSAEATKVVERALEVGRISARGYNRVRLVARTVADLAGHDGQLEAEHLLTALQLRSSLPVFTGVVADAS